jgi:hypothetical protein
VHLGACYFHPSTFRSCRVDFSSFHRAFGSSLDCSLGEEDLSLTHSVAAAVAAVEAAAPLAALGPRRIRPLGSSFAT